MNFQVPAFSHRAVDALRAFLEPNGEILPLVSPVGEYYAYNTTTVVDALDEDASGVVWMKKEWGLATRIQKYVFDCGRLNDAPIFRIVQLLNSVFVSQAFVDAAMAAGLKGMNFKLVHPSADGDGAATSKGPAGRKARPVAATMANTVVVLLPTKKPKPSKREKTRVEAILNELDALLYRAEADPDEYVGSLEGHDHDRGAFRLFLTSADADKLVDRLRDQLLALPWDGPMVVLKRYGHLHDPDCPEEIAFERV